MKVSETEPLTDVLVDRYVKVEPVREPEVVEEAVEEDCAWTAEAASNSQAAFKNVCISGDYEREEGKEGKSLEGRGCWRMNGRRPRKRSVEDGQRDNIITDSSWRKLARV